MFEDIIKDMLEKGLIETAKRDGVLRANKLYQQLKILKYTATQTMPDVFTSFLREHWKN